MIFQELGLINEIRNELMHSFEPDNPKILEFCNFLLYHPYNDKKSNVEKAAYDALEIMSQLCEILDKIKQSSIRVQASKDSKWWKFMSKKELVLALIGVVLMTLGLFLFYWLVFF